MAGYTVESNGAANNAAVMIERARREIMALEDEITELSGSILTAFDENSRQNFKRMREEKLGKIRELNDTITDLQNKIDTYYSSQTDQ